MATMADLPASAKLMPGDEWGGHQGEVGPGGTQAQLTWKVPAVDFPEFMATARGKVEQVGPPTAPIAISVPLVYPLDPNSWAQRIGYRGFGLDETCAPTQLHPWYAVTVYFGTNPFPMTGDSAFVSVRINGVANQVTVPNVPFHFAGNGEKVEQDVSTCVGEYALEITRHYVPSLDYVVAALTPYVGCVSNADVTVGATVYPAGTLLFPTFNSEFDLSMQGAVNQSLSYNVHYRPVSWQQAMRSDGVWDDLVPLPFSEADLNGLFTGYAS